MNDSDRALPFVSVNLNGQLGNQMFMIATALAYAWEYNSYPIFPSLLVNVKREGRLINKDRIFYRLDFSDNPRPYLNYYKEARRFNYNRIPFLPDVMLDGFFISWKYFEKYRVKILETFAPSDLILASLHEHYLDLIENPKTVAVHVRTRNRKDHLSRIHPTLNFEYYESAMAHFPVDSTFVIFSDKIEWTKMHFSRSKLNLVFIDDNYIDELFLMTLMKNNIISASSFGWWGAYLNKNPDKMVVSPNDWGKPDGADYVYNYEDMLLPDWIRQPLPEHYWPYPSDLDLYPTKSLFEGCYKPK